jgi:hypothetical protein
MKGLNGSSLAQGRGQWCEASQEVSTTARCMGRSMMMWAPLKFLTVCFGSLAT